MNEQDLISAKYFLVMFTRAFEYAMASFRQIYTAASSQRPRAFGTDTGVLPSRFRAEMSATGFCGRAQPPYHESRTPRLVIRSPIALQPAHARRTPAFSTLAPRRRCLPKRQFREACAIRTSPPRCLHRYPSLNRVPTPSGWRTEYRQSQIRPDHQSTSRYRHESSTQNTITA